MKEGRNTNAGRAARIFAFRFLFVISLFILNFSLFTRCANQVAPQGGPKDSLPPVVKVVAPVGGRNLTPSRIFIEFDEYVQLRDLSKEFYTSPLMKTKPTVVPRGRGIRIDIKDTLAENQTYSLNFGSAIRDNNEGNPLTGYSYVFSTGPSMDSLLATGYVADAMKGDSVGKAYIYFFDAALDTIPDYDSIMFLHQPAKVGRAENNGIFVAQNLRGGPYKVYALFDANNNQRYDPGSDKVGFLDSLLEPALLEPTSVWLDEYRRYPTADPQTYFRLFGEPAPMRQNLTASERPGRHQVILRFAAANPQIDTLSFEGIPDERVIREYMTVGRDTMTLWFDVSPDRMPDTLKGRISYHKPDSLGNIVPTSQPLRLTWREPVESREEAREREREERERQRAAERGEEYAEPKKANPFRFKVDAGAEVNPEKSIPIEFDLPLSSLDSARITLTTASETTGKGTPVPFRVVRDTMNIRRWVVTAEWDETQNYSLVVPAGVFVNVAGERNDSLGATFKIQRKSDFGTIALKVTGKTPESKYIVQLVDSKGATIRELKDVVSGGYTFNFVPEGEVRIRITEDGNGNGRWDSGALVARRQPERTEFYASQPSGDQVITVRPGWQNDAELDMAYIFAPVSISRLRADLQRAEDARVSKYLEEKAARDAERQRQGTQNQNGMGLGIGSALGGAKGQLQSAIR
jgi:predicted GIY-YIG superfamily endonuclease